MAVCFVRKVLDISGNAIERVPQLAVALPALAEINLDENALRSLGDELVGLSKLKKLSARANRIAAVDPTTGQQVTESDKLLEPFIFFFIIFLFLFLVARWKERSVSERSFSSLQKHFPLACVVAKLQMDGDRFDEENVLVARTHIAQGEVPRVNNARFAANKRVCPISNHGE